MSETWDDPFSEDGKDEEPEEKSEPPFEEICELPNGATLYRQANGAGGYTYWSDEIGGGVMVWDTCLVGEDTLLVALAEEHRRRIKEQREKRAKQ